MQSKSSQRTGVIGKALGLSPWWSLAIIAAVIGSAGYAWYSYIHSPQRVVGLAFSALESRNIQRLVELASSRERAELNLTPDTVRAYLQGTWWRDSQIRSSVSIGPPRARFSNVLDYETYVSGFSRDGKSSRIDVEVYRDGDGIWRLVLSPLLYIMPRICNGVEGDHAPVWDMMARRAGIKGVMGADGKARYTDGTFARLSALTRD
jgi:hypothetical protein